MEYLEGIVDGYAKMIIERGPYIVYCTFTFEDVFVHIEQAKKSSDQLIKRIEERMDHGEKSKASIAYVKVTEYQKLGFKKSVICLHFLLKHNLLRKIPCSEIVKIWKSGARKNGFAKVTKYKAKYKRDLAYYLAKHYLRGGEIEFSQAETWKNISI